MFILLQKLIPQHCLSRFIGYFSDKKNWTALKNKAIASYIRYYGVNMDEAIESDYTQYPTFNEFFTRRLKPGSRPIAEDKKAIVSPVDGCISEIGTLDGHRLLQAKNIYYELPQLLGSKRHAQSFQNGSFMTAYLAPVDYHRFHMPIDGKLLTMTHIPGKLFSVNPYTVSHIPHLFAINERVVSIFETEIGKMAYIAVGAVIVGGIAMRWHGTVTPPTRKEQHHWDYHDQNIELSRGEEVGYFKLGSTIIVIFESNKIKWDAYLKPTSKLKMGQSIAQQITIQ